MVKRNMLRLSPLCLVLAFAMVLVSCSKEDRFDNWLTKKDGDWKVVSSSETIVSYNGSDSTVTTNASSDITGTFIFNEDGSFDYDFKSTTFNLDFKSSGERLLDGKTFSHYLESDLTFDQLKQWISGEKESSRSLRIKMRTEWWNLSGLYLAVNHEMELERGD
jgi:hypothetical protein